MPAQPHPLLPQALAGDKRSIRELIADLTPIIQARAARVLARRRLSRSRDIRQEVLDLTQQVFVDLFRDDARLLRSWDPERGLSLPNFVGMIAEQRVLAVLRNRSKNPWRDEPTAPEDLDVEVDSGRGPERVAASKEVLSAVLDALRDRLSDQGIAMFHWLFVEGRTVDEVCSLAETSPDAVYAWRSRIGKLARQLAHEILSEKGSVDHTPKETT